jgi:hypothetical protein
LDKFWLFVYSRLHEMYGDNHKLKFEQIRFLSKTLRPKCFFYKIDSRPPLSSTSSWTPASPSSSSSTASTHDFFAPDEFDRKKKIGPEFPETLQSDRHGLSSSTVFVRPLTICSNIFSVDVLFPICLDIYVMFFRLFTFCSTIYILFNNLNFVQQFTFCSAIYILFDYLHFVRLLTFCSTYSFQFLF